MTGGRVIFVDDDPDLRRATARALKLAGFDVRAFDGAEAALAAIDASFDGPVVTDIRMPRMNGLDATRRIRQLGPTPRPLIVAVTGWGQIADRERSYEAGCDLHLTKPVELEVLLKILKRLPHS